MDKIREIGGGDIRKNKMLAHVGSPYVINQPRTLLIVKEITINYSRTTGVNQNCPRETRIYVHPKTRKTM